MRIPAALVTLFRADTAEHLIGHALPERFQVPPAQFAPKVGEFPTFTRYQRNNVVHAHWFGNGCIENPPPVRFNELPKGVFGDFLGFFYGNHLRFVFVKRYGERSAFEGFAVGYFLYYGGLVQVADYQCFASPENTVSECAVGYFLSDGFRPHRRTKSIRLNNIIHYNIDTLIIIIIIIKSDFLFYLIGQKVSDGETEKRARHIRHQNLVLAVRLCEQHLRQTVRWPLACGFRLPTFFPLLSFRFLPNSQNWSERPRRLCTAGRRCTA
jgi:hypothetical protein